MASQSTEVTKTDVDKQTVPRSPRKRPLTMVNVTEVGHHKMSGAVPADEDYKSSSSKEVPDQQEIDGRIVENKDGNFTETDACVSRSPALDPAAEYKMKYGRRGLALIFNHEWFNYRLRMPERRGTTADRFNLERSLTQLGFEVKHYFNCPAAEVHQHIQDAATSDHSDADCFLCVFLSHGENGQIYAHDCAIEVKDLTSPFKGDKCPSLAGKPKIFIFQACRGDQHDEPVLVTDATDSAGEPEVNRVEVDAAALYTLPAAADFIMCYSVAEGYYSHRETVNGSWYIQDLCEAIRMHGKELEFTELLTLVNRMVSLRSVEGCLIVGANGKKQVPCFASMLTKKLYLRPK
ncbi:caspase-6 isoform X2 [Rana temporaria]|uniref:caspase-6 isoform X2 n=1 Tax=Rana temporaria TaxID=8407 RepID=UPI001AAC5A18|nr:caspase-6 isoform X2 [Rana temporaria]